MALFVLPTLASFANLIIHQVKGKKKKKEKNDPFKDCPTRCSSARAENFLATQMREMKLLLTGEKAGGEASSLGTIRTVPEPKLSSVVNDFLLET